MAEHNLLDQKKRKSGSMDLLHGSIGDKILKFALPLALTSVLQQLFSATDTAVVGTFVGKESMAAVGSNAPVIGLLVNLFAGISVGANVIIARYTGQDKPKRANQAVHTAIVMAFISGIIIALLGNLVAVPIIELLGVPPEVAPLSLRYLRIYFCGMPFYMLYNFEAAIFRSQGDTKTPLIFLSVSGCINVVLNLFFVVICHMDVEGVAIATVIANAFSTVALFVLLCRSKEEILRVKPRELRIHGSMLKGMLSIGLPSGMQGMVFSISNLIIQSAINSLGADVMAGSAAAYNIEIFGYFVVNAFGQAAVTFIGQNYGAGDFVRCHKIVKQVLLLGGVVTVMVSVALICFGRPLLGLFNDDPEVIAIGLVRVRVLLGTEILNGTNEILSGIMRGLGHSLSPALVSFFGVCGTRILWVYTFFAMHPSWMNLMIIYPVSWIVTLIILTAEFRRLSRKLIPLPKPEKALAE